MTEKEHFHLIAEGRSGHCGFWHGNPHPAAIDKLYEYFKVNDDTGLALKLKSGLRWITGEYYNMWTNTEEPMFDTRPGMSGAGLDGPGIFAGAEDLSDIENYHWPDVKYVDWADTIKDIDKANAAGLAVMSGTMSAFYHIVSEYFGMESYFMNMVSNPKIVEAVTRKIVDFYLEANELLFNQIGNKIDAMFIGNDFGSQQDLLISPEYFDRFILPYFKELVDQGHRHGYKIVLHSCGSIYRVIPRLIDAGVDILHPIQALARNMDAATLAREFKGKIVFLGGLDAQQILPFGKPEDVRSEVRRLKDIFGPNYLVSGSHESLLPNIPIENLIAMAETAAE